VFELGRIVLTSRTCCDMGLQFLRSHPKTVALSLLLTGKKERSGLTRIAEGKVKKISFVKRRHANMLQEGLHCIVASMSV
jgi:hypothetical protein